MAPAKDYAAELEFEEAMNVGKPKDDFVFEDNTTGEHRVVPRLYIRPRSDYEGKNSVRAKPDLNSIKFSPDGRIIAAALSNGRIACYDTESGKTKYNADTGDPRHEKFMWNPEEEEHGPARHGDYRESPMRMSYQTPGKQPSLIAETNEDDEDSFERPAIVAMRWLPSPTCQENGHYDLLSSNTDGIIQKWRLTSPYDPEMITFRSPRLKRTGTDADTEDYDFDGIRCIESFHTEKGYESRALGLDYDYIGGKFAAACKDAVVRIYDNETSKCVNLLDGGLGHDFEIGAEFQMVGDMKRFYSVMERRRMKKVNAMDVVRKAEIKEMKKELQNANVNVIKRHSNRVYAVKFGRLAGQIAENLVASAGWDRTMQIWDVREKCAAPIHSFSGAFVCGDGVDIFGNDILVASHQEENQITVFDLRAHKSPREMYAVKGNNMYAAGFSKGELEHDRFFCCGGIGGEGFDKSQKNNVHIIDVKRDYQLAATVRDLPGGVVSLDWDPYTTHPPSNSSPINSSKGSVPSGIVAIGCGNGEIRIHEVCTQRSIKFCDDAEVDIVDGEEDDDDIFEDYIERKYGGYNSEQIKQVKDQRHKHRGVPIPSDSPIHMVREHSKHFDFKSTETIILDGPNARTVPHHTPGQQGEGGDLKPSNSEPILGSPREGENAIVGGPNKKNIKNLRVNASSAGGMTMSQSLEKIQASPEAEVQVHSIEGEMDKVSTAEHGTFKRVTSFSVKKLKVGVHGRGGGEGDDDGDPDSHVAVVPPPLVDAPGHDLHDHRVSPKEYGNKRVRGRVNEVELENQASYEKERAQAMLDHAHEVDDIEAMKARIAHRHHNSDPQKQIDFEKEVAQRHLHDSDASMFGGRHGETVETTHHHQEADGDHRHGHHGNGHSHHKNKHKQEQEHLSAAAKALEKEEEEMFAHPAPAHLSISMDHGFRGEEDLELSGKKTNS